ncbi:thioredoxin-like protein [Hypomontagnella monticulosa]|nr:thioredoxin-like protein [Hypomontagnella monticulosa]
MGGHIDLYLDIASLYSYITLIQVLNNQDLLKQHSVEIEVHPFLLGAVNGATGNKPPWVVPAKAAFGAHDSRRSLAAVGLSNVSPPGDLMEAGKTQFALRGLSYIKSHFPVSTYLSAWRALFHAFWTEHRPPNNADALRAALDAAKLFTSAEVEEIVKAAGAAEYKDVLRRTTEEAVGRGAFGAPWFWVTNAATGRSEPFFGSDRWHHMYEFLGLPFQAFALLPPDVKGSGSKL